MLSMSQKKVCSHRRQGVPLHVSLLGALLLTLSPITFAKSSGAVDGKSQTVTSESSSSNGETANAKHKRLTLLITFYGFLDNSPPGAGIALPVLHSQAGGTGTFADPITFATDQQEFAPGTIIYVPFLKKYFIMEDECVACDQDFANGIMHVDLWTGGDANSSQNLIDCEDGLTQNAGEIIVNPHAGRAVDTTPLFNAQTGACFQPGN